MPHEGVQVKEWLHFGAPFLRGIPYSQTPTHHIYIERWCFPKPLLYSPLRGGVSTRFWETFTVGKILLYIVYSNSTWWRQMVSLGWWSTQAKDLSAGLSTWWCCVCPPGSTLLWKPSRMYQHCWTEALNGVALSNLKPPDKAGWMEQQHR